MKSFPIGHSSNYIQPSNKLVQIKMSETKHWGEIDGNIDQLSYVPKVDFSSLIELAMQPNSEADMNGRGSLVELPVQNLTLQTVRLVEHSRRVAAAMSAGEVPPAPLPDPFIGHQQNGKTLFRNHEKIYLPWTQVKQRSVAPLGASARRQALTQAAALVLSTRPYAVSATRATLDALADAVDHFLRIITSTMRTVVDRESASQSSGYADIMSRVFAELGITGLQSWYTNCVLGSYEAAQQSFVEAPVTDVPQLHFPASLEELGDSLGPGFQMLHTLESGQLPALHLLDGDSDNLELGVLAEEESPPVSPTAKKKIKLEFK
ncbi:uncharacterized protein LOC143920281 isoform X1 [Arctopsyche grandis]|uniref:uncharacterized protein LOC143920281 isoform X1 n=1 Tax=Arctopsyche grandis TaxID=121162 RepID=UPI00406D682C